MKERIIRTKSGSYIMKEGEATFENLWIGDISLLEFIVKDSQGRLLGMVCESSREFCYFALLKNPNLPSELRQKFNGYYSALVNRTKHRNLYK